MKPVTLHLSGVLNIHSVSDCINRNFADFITFWRHNGYWLFDSPEAIKAVAISNSISLDDTTLFYYEGCEREFDGQAWHPFTPEASLQTNVALPFQPVLYGYDVVTFYAGTSPECSPLSCNGLAEEVTTNVHCLFETLEEAKKSLESGAFAQGEPGPYRIYAVYLVDWDTDL